MLGEHSFKKKMASWVYVAKPTHANPLTVGGRASVFDTATSKEVYDALRARTRGLRTHRFFVAVLPTGDEVRVDSHDHSWAVYTTEASNVSPDPGASALVFKERVSKSKAAPLASFYAYLDEYTLEESRAGPLRLSRRIYSSGEELFEVATTARTRAAALEALATALHL